MFKADIDTRELVRNLSSLEKRHFPFAFMQTLNDAAFDVRSGWRDEMPRVFHNPTRWTLDGVLVKKATKDTLVAEVFLRNELGDAIPPAQYLQFQVRGGQRAAKRSEILLRSAGVLGANEFVVPAKGAPLDPHGNLPGSTLQAILSDLQASFDPQQRSTRESRAKRLRRRKRQAGVYFYNRAQRGKLPRGIYERRNFAHGSSLRGVLMIVDEAQYEPIYDVFGLAQQIFRESFHRRWRDNLTRAVARIKRT